MSFRVVYYVLRVIDVIQILYDRYQLINRVASKISYIYSLVKDVFVGFRG